MEGGILHTCTPACTLSGGDKCRQKSNWYETDSGGQICAVWCAEGVLLRWHLSKDPSDVRQQQGRCQGQVSVGLSYCSMQKQLDGFSSYLDGI